MILMRTLGRRELNVKSSQLEGEEMQLPAETPQSGRGRGRAPRWEKSGEGEEDRTVVEPNMNDYTTDSYYLSIVFLFTCMSFERGAAEVGGFEGVAWD
jgi:hypothetical protein